MPSSRHRSSPTGQSTVRVAGRDWPVLDRFVLGRRTYLVLEKVGHADRQRYMAFDPHAGDGGQLCALMALPKNHASRQHLRVLKRLSAGNSNLPLILDFQNRQDQLIVVSTWVTGPDLGQYLDDVRAGRKPRPSATEAFRLVRGLAHGLAQMHRGHTIIHGDLKPANLILASKPSRLVMIDYGSAWLTPQTAGRQDGDGVSPAYAAPELQHQGARLADARSDQFSASVILYELLTLVRPYDNLGGQAGRPEFIERMNDKLVAPHKLSPDRGQLPTAVWRGIDEVVTKGLALCADERFPTSPLWIDALDQVHVQMRPGSHLSPLNARMTRVVDWLSRQLGRE